MPTPSEIEEIFNKFHKTLNEWPRDGGLFLDLMKEKLKKLEQTFANEIALQVPADALGRKKAATLKNATGEKEIYVALYQMQGDNLEKWANMLNSIAMQGVSRPIYENEADVCNMIRSKAHKSKEGYAVIKVAEKDIVRSPVPHVDRDGKVLLHVKPGALKSDNILRFVNATGQYLWQKGSLVKLDVPSPIVHK